MKKIGWFSRLSNRQQSVAMAQCKAGVLGIALLMTGAAGAQNSTTPDPGPKTQVSAPLGYSIHHSIDLGGNMVSVNGSQAMYDTMVNQQSGPRVQGQSFELHALPSNKKPLLDDMRAFVSGFGGDPNNVVKMDASKAKIYEFTGLFRRDRQYFDYDLLGNANIAPTTLNNMSNGVAVPVGTWGSEMQSPVMFNTVRRMLDTGLTIYPLAKVTYRVAYAHNTFSGPSLSPGEVVGKFNNLLQQNQQNGTDNYTFGLDWKPLQATKVTLEEEINYYKDDTYYTLAPQSYNVQEADGTKASMGDWDAQFAMGLDPAALASGATTSIPCNTVAMGTAYTSTKTYTMFTAPQVPGGLPVINPACDVATSYLRTQPTRIHTPTSTLRLQSSSIKNIALNGDFRYTLATMNLGNFAESFQGLNGVIRTENWGGSDRGHRAVVAADFGIVWEASKKFSLSDQVNFSSVQQPGHSTLNTAVTMNLPATAGVAGVNGCVTSTAGGCETINYSGALTAGTGSQVTGSSVGTEYTYLGQNQIINNLTASYDVTARTRLSLTYRHSTRTIAEAQASPGAGFTDNQPLAIGSDINGTVTVNEDGGIFNAAFHPMHNWDINGSITALYDDNAFTPVAPRQTRQYKVHTKYKPNAWTTLTAAFNDRERHNNTNNQQLATSLATDAAPIAYDGPLNHVDSYRSVSMGAQLAPNEYFALDLNYAYTDVYAATNICFFNGVATSLPGVPGTATLTSTGAPAVCTTSQSTSGTTITPTITDWFARDFSDAPTQYGSASVMLSPDKSIHFNIGYRINEVSGSEFYNDARMVKGALSSTYQSPFASVAWTVHPGLIWKASYNTYRYGEGPASGPQYCTTQVVTTAIVNAGTVAAPVSCSSLYNATTGAGVTGLTEPTSGLTAAREFRANNITLGLHYEF
jgi:hypothetical protein